MSVCAIILAGGQASRMQGEKPLRLLRGKTLLEHSKDLVAPLADEILVASGTRDMPLPEGVRAAPDAAQFNGRGPLAGVLAGLEATQANQAIVLACDLPNVPAALLGRMLAALGDDCDCCCAPSAAVYTSDSRLKMSNTKYRSPIRRRFPAAS